MNDLRKKQTDVLNTVEIDKACNDLRLILKNGLNWLDQPYHISQRFPKVNENGKRFVLPQIYVLEEERKNYTYVTLTPDDGFKCLSFFVVSNETVDFQPGNTNFMTYNVGIIFCANLEKIDANKLKTENLFTQELIRDVRRLLTKDYYNLDFEFKIIGATRDLFEVFKEFSIDDLEQYNRAPMQTFRLNLQITLDEDCI